jgi:hypothetical protein
MNKASVRKRKNKIVKLMDGENVVEGDENILNHENDFYKSLFGHSERNSIGLVFDVCRMISADENDDLTKKISYE